MKRLATILLGLMLASCSMGYYDSGVLLATTANISVQPAWGPAGYDCAHYYYFPDYNFYYDVNRALFYYHHGNRWLSARQLPYQLGYPRDLYKFYKVVLNIRDPWNYNRRHISEYRHFKGVHTQPVLRDHNPNRYHNYKPQHGNNYGPSYNNRPQQTKPPKSNGNRYDYDYNYNYNYNYDNRNTIRNSRNNNTSQNSVTTQPSNSRRNNNSVGQSTQRQESQAQGSRNSARERNKQNDKSSKSVRQSDSSSNKNSTNSTNSRSSEAKNSNREGGSRSTGSRGR